MNDSERPAHTAPAKTWSRAVCTSLDVGHYSFHILSKIMRKHPGGAHKIHQASRSSNSHQQNISVTFCAHEHVDATLQIHSVKSTEISSRRGCLFPSPRISPRQISARGKSRKKKKMASKAGNHT
jgi:hypothetical protein